MPLEATPCPLYDTQELKPGPFPIPPEFQNQPPVFVFFNDPPSPDPKKTNVETPGYLAYPKEFSVEGIELWTNKAASSSWKVFLVVGDVERWVKPVSAFTVLDNFRYFHGFQCRPHIPTMQQFSVKLVLNSPVELSQGIVARIQLNGYLKRERA